MTVNVITEAPNESAELTSRDIARQKIVDIGEYLTARTYERNSAPVVEDAYLGDK